MIGALWTGISGLAAQQTALDNESHNIANVNTVGYKASRISFADQMYQNKIGKGSQVQDAEKMYTQGNLKLTGVNYDMALSGDGFFAVSDSRGGGTSEVYYTRAGNFRMGDPGTLQDSIGNDVQGWAMSSNPVVESSNSNVNIFTNDYNKMLSSKIIKYTSAVETITAKATDFTITAKDDNPTIFTGAGLKTKSGKIADIEELVKAYTSKLQNLKSDPNSSSATAISQISHIDLPNQNNAGVLNTNAISQDGDEVYIYINGDKISQSYITGTNEADGYRKTMKAFADLINERVSGIKAYVADDVAPVPPNTIHNYVPSTVDADVNKGILKIESLVPGRQFTISSTGMVHAGNDKPGTYSIDTKSDEGKGLGALESVRNALNMAISGKQTDIYTKADLGNGVDGNEYSYRITVYDKGLGKNVEMPNDGDVSKKSVLPLKLSGGIDNMVIQLNASTLNSYVHAENINGNLVIKTLDTNFDVEYSGDLKITKTAELQTISVSGTATGAVSFLGTAIASSASGDTALETTNRIIADKTSIINTWNTNNGTKEIADITASGTEINIIYKSSEGDVASIADGSNNGITFPVSIEVIAYNTNSSDIKRNADYSGREGAGAEFMEIKTRIDQAATKGKMQLRLDSLKISDSAFGDFKVDNTGLITMSQDGATYAVGQVAIAKFITNRGLEPVGNNMLRKTLASGDPIYNLNNSKTAEIKSNTLELSTADLSESLVNLMVFQRAFEANAKSITTADTILNTLIQLKR